MAPGNRRHLCLNTTRTKKDRTGSRTKPTAAGKKAITFVKKQPGLMQSSGSTARLSDSEQNYLHPDEIVASSFTFIQFISSFDNCAGEIIPCHAKSPRSREDRQFACAVLERRSVSVAVR